MNCREAKALLRDIALPALLPSDAAAHVESCPRCSVLFERERNLADRLVALGEGTKDLGATAAMEPLLRAAFRDHWRDNFEAEVSRHVPLLKVRSIAKKPLFAAGIAAVAVFSLAVLLSERNGPERPAELSQVSASPAASQPVPQMAAVPAPIPDGSAPVPEAASLAASREEIRKSENFSTQALSAERHAVASLEFQPVLESEPAGFDTPVEQARSEFVPLFYGGDPQLIESAQVWRVEMPRAALQSVGLPVVEESLSSRIQVDVRLGEDGIARAIRLVQ
jgi:hypothetical protein